MKKIRCTNPVLLIYLAWVYFLPALVNWATGYQSEIYVNPSNSALTWAYGGLLLCITATFSFSITQSTTHTTPATPVVWQVPIKSMVLVLVIIFGVSLLGATSGLSRWRYSAEGLSGSLGPLELMFVLAPNILELMLFAMLFFKHTLPTHTTRTLLLLLTICLGLTASGIGPMLAVLLALVAALAPETLRHLILRHPPALRTTRQKQIASRIVLLAPVVLTLGFVSYLVGDAIKKESSIADVLNDLGQEGTDLFLNYLVGRLSVHWYSLVAALHQYVELDLSGQFQNLLAPITNAGFRLSSLLGNFFLIERPLDGSMARINYTLINLYPFSDREGTTPGLIASFVIAFPIWLGPFALSAYLWLYTQVQKGLRRRIAGQPTWLGEVLLLYFTAVFFSSPLDFLLVFDPMLLTVGAWCYMAYQANQTGGAHGSIRKRAA